MKFLTIANDETNGLSFILQMQIFLTEQMMTVDPVNKNH